MLNIKLCVRSKKRTINYIKKPLSTTITNMENTSKNVVYLLYIVYIIFIKMSCLTIKFIRINFIMTRSCYLKHVFMNARE